ncbi:hypothetical protein [Mucilaginibacter sp. UR6-11]|uniref:hypothetical protein n=1 Tax=Mucilaginibacter sp. UR6-11 TaxID=1435644 RepID=UPI001E2E0F61|nr:hypothetical protein [Mucilaginibacter sp. UR6-11]MCC8427257.1 hypothetical protein [Mucilaginibacter sp. UR6-11]
MKVKFHLFSILLLCGISLEGSAQVSYNKRAMGLIGNAPKANDFLNGASLDNVDMSTGTLKIGIPLYEIKVNDISVPITLNYSATGLKVGQEAGPAGMGWELSAGGKIITNVQGMNDHLDYGIRQGSIPEPFNYGPTGNTHDQNLLHSIIDGKVDNAWDTYTYILPHGGGTYAQNGLTFPYDPLIKIKGQDTIITTDGLKYTFTTGDTKKTTKKINYDGSATNSLQYDYLLIDHYPITWSDYDLHSIISTRFKDVVNFKYQHLANYNYIARRTAKTRTNVSESLPLYRKVGENSLGHGGYYPVENDKYYNVMEPMVSKSVTEYVDHSILDTIDFSTGMVVFDYGDDILGRDVLNNIRIFKKENNTLSLIKRYEFLYNPDVRYGHYLYAIKIYNDKNIFQNFWEFTYAYSNLPIVPNSGSCAQDRWGFYNGKDTNKTLLERPDSVLAVKLFPHYPIIGNEIKYTRPEAIDYYGGINSDPDPVHPNIFRYKLNFADRSYNFFAAESGTLSSIKTPAGALFQYEYESHTFSYIENSGLPGNSVAGTRFVAGGGIRVKSITEKRGHESLYYGVNTAEATIKKIYKYGNALPNGSNAVGESNGYGQATVPYVILSNLSAYYYDSPLNLSTYTYVKNMIELSHPINDLVQYNSSYVMYPSVTEILLKDITNGVSTNTHGKTVYYNNLPLFDPYESAGYVSPYVAAGSFFNPYKNSQMAEPSYNSASYPGPPIFAPYFSNNMGFSPETGAGIYSICKFDNNDMEVQSTDYQFQFFQSPQTAEHHLINVYAALMGQASGPAPTTTGYLGLYDAPVLIGSGAGGPQVNGIDAAFNSEFQTSEHGAMDFLTRSYYFDQGLGQTVDYPFKYAVRMLDLNNFSYNMKKIKETTHDFVNNTTTFTNYFYGNKDHMLPTRIATTSKPKLVGQPGADSVITTRIYVYDYLKMGLPNVELARVMDRTRMGLDEPLMEITSLKSGVSGSTKPIDGIANTFQIVDDAIVPEKTYKVNPPDVWGTALPSLDVMHYTGVPIDTTIYKEQVSYDTYFKGQVHQYAENGGRSNIVLWGYNNQFPIAKITNAGNVTNTNIGGKYNFISADVAYTSFETKDTCNWIYAGNPIIDTTAVSGKKAYALTSGAITKVNATPSGKYIVSYWYKSGSVVIVTGGAISAPVVKSTLGNWVLAEQEVSNVTGSLTVSGTGYIDELRFYPKEAQMNTYLYDPLIGVTCTIDANGRPLYYEYDESQRLKQIRDHNGNIIKAYQYVIGNQN